MPWTARDAYRHTKKASTPGAQSKWAKTANSVLEQSGDEAKAIRIANSVVENASKTQKKRPIR
jgi:uncharacterized protein YdaT